jgi:hypothetical protein
VLVLGAGLCLAISTVRLRRAGRAS